jgi:SAM-dependent methyltransferase
MSVTNVRRPADPFHGVGDVRSIPGFGDLSPADQGFLQRVFATPAERYLDRIEALGMVGHDRVLDLGCGFGQWSLCLAAVNRSVVAVEPDESRLAVLRGLAAACGLEGLEIARGSGEAIPLEAQSVDAVFCFGVLQYLDPVSVAKEMARVLRPGGRAYVTGKDIGGYLYFWCEQPNHSDDYDPRQIAADAFANTLFLERFGRLFPDARNPDRVVSCKQLCDAAESCGLRVVATGAEGSIRVGEGAAPGGFFTSEYRGFPKAYEVLFEKGPAK